MTHQWDWFWKGMSKFCMKFIGRHATVWCSLVITGVPLLIFKFHSFLISASSISLHFLVGHMGWEWVDICLVGSFPLISHQRPASSSFHLKIILLWILDMDVSVTQSCWHLLTISLNLDQLKKRIFFSGKLLLAAGVHQESSDWECTSNINAPKVLMWRIISS